jgi:hypothetical protein
MSEYLVRNKHMAEERERNSLVLLINNKMLDSVTPNARITIPLLVPFVGKNVKMILIIVEHCVLKLQMTVKLI